MEGLIFPQNLGLSFVRTAAYDVITEAHICKIIKEEFGTRYLRGSCISNESVVNGNEQIKCQEFMFRNILKNKNINSALEIGTSLGVGSLLLSHYANYLITVDNMPRTEPLPLWSYFGVYPKIIYAVTQDLATEKEYINTLDFDFAMLGLDSDYDSTKFLFNCIKRCGRVLFHNVIHDRFKKVISELPQEEVEFIGDSFAYWEKRDNGIFA